LQAIRREASFIRAGAGFVLCLAVVMGWLLVAQPAPAFAAYPLGVSLVAEDDGTTTLSYRAPPGQINDVTVTGSGASYTVTDSGVSSISAAEPCTVTGNQATCPAGGVSVVRVNADDMDDTVTVNVSTFAKLLGGSGNDFLSSRNDAAGKVTCGADSDVAVVDAADSTAVDCEQVDLPPDTSITLHPNSLTNDPSALFSLFSTEQPANFECQLDGAGWASCSAAFYDGLSDGVHTFDARATDAFGPDPSPAAFTWTVDTTPPQVVIGAPNTNSGGASFSFGGVDEVTAPESIALECRLDGGAWAACSSPTAYTGLSEGSHTFSVHATDEAGNSSEGMVTFTIKVTGPAPTASPPPPPSPVVASKPKPLSLVLISGRAIRVSQRRVAATRLSCSGNLRCSGVVSLATAGPVRVARKRIVTLASAKFRISSGHVKAIKLHLPRKMFQLVKKLKRIPAVVVVKDHDGSGRKRLSTRPVLVRAPR
jgi:hypothetical protein